MVVPKGFAIAGGLGPEGTAVTIRVTEAGEVLGLAQLNEKLDRILALLEKKNKKEDD